MESAKHVHILQILIDVLKIGPPEYKWEYGIDLFVGQWVTKREIRKHIKEEKEMTQTYEEIIKRTDI